MQNKERRNGKMKINFEKELKRLNEDRMLGQKYAEDVWEAEEIQADFEISVENLLKFVTTEEKQKLKKVLATMPYYGKVE